MKVTILLIIFTFSILSSFSQNKQPRGILDSYSSNVFYRNVKYRMTAIVSNPYIDSELSGGNVEISEDPEYSYGYFVTFGELKESQIRVHGLTEKGEKITLSAYVFQIEEKSKPKIYLDTVRCGALLNFIPRQIRCQYPDEINLKEEFEVSSWKVSIGGIKFNGRGADLSKELQDYLGGIVVQVPITIEINYANQLGVSSNEIAVFLYEGK